MKKIFVLNGAPKYAHSGGRFNKTLTSWTVNFFHQQNGFDIKHTDINKEYDLNQEVEKFVWQIWLFTILLSGGFNFHISLKNI